MSSYIPPYMITEKMLELGLVRMTIPEKPRSRNQRYVKGAQ